MSRATRFGKPLPDDGCVGIVGTSTTWYNRSELLRAVDAWERRGYRVKLGAHIYDRDDYQAGHPKDRAADMNAMYADREVDLVHAFQGGYTAAQMLPYLDYDLIATNPKALVGFSDVTALHTALLERSGLATFYGPGAAGLGDPERGDWSKERLLKVLKDGGVGPVPPNPDDPYVRAIRGGTVTAPLVGGCLWLLQHAIGTPWAPNLDGCIFFWEDVDTPTTYLEAHLAHLQQAGLLDRIAGVVVGELHNCDWHKDRPEWARVPSIEDVLERYLEPLGVPVLYRLPLGHGKHLATVPLGVMATLDADAETLTIDEPAVVPGA